MLRMRQERLEQQKKEFRKVTSANGEKTSQYSQHKTNLLSGNSEHELKESSSPKQVTLLFDQFKFVPPVRAVEDREYINPLYYNEGFDLRTKVKKT
jgi:hypothetical protein